MLRIFSYKLCKKSAICGYRRYTSARCDLGENRGQHIIPEIRRSGGRPPAFAAHHQAALAAWGEAAVEHEQAQARQAEARGLRRELGQLYHPYDLVSGVAQPVAAVAARFASVWTRPQRLAAVADLPARARAHLAKAARVTTKLLAPLRQSAHPLQRPPAEERTHIEQVATDCANLFPRSPSAVEGRNGHLALFHHGCHRLSTRKLAALTAVHNYHSRRPDGTTAARRFFGRAHAPLFEQLLDRVALPPRPRRHRPPRLRQPYLMPLAA
jgi:hypothetical protein